MPAPSKTKTAAKRKPPVPKPAAKAADARDGLSVADLARGILDKVIRSRAQDVRRLAEAVLAGGARPKKAKKDKAGKDKADGKKKDKSKKKLAKIPGQQAKN
jgi:hypothetical protein